MNYVEPTYEELRRVPGFPKPRLAARLSLWFQAHKGAAITLWILAALTLQIPFLIGWALYCWRADVGRAEHLEIVRAWYHEHWLDIETARLAY